MITEDFFTELQGKILSLLGSEEEGHGMDHTLRVYRLSLTLAQEEKADLDIIRAAALLHDIARNQEGNGKVLCHAEEGAKMAKHLLEATSFPPEKIDSVCYAIAVHRYSQAIHPQTKEAAILQDADRLDALGAIIIARALRHSGKLGKPIEDPSIPIRDHYVSPSPSVFHHLYEKILKITPETFHTAKAKALAQGRYAFVQEFIERYIKESQGSL